MSKGEEINMTKTETKTLDEILMATGLTEEEFKLKVFRYRVPKILSYCHISHSLII